MTENQNVQTVIQSVLDGVATEEQRGMATRAVQNTLSIELINLITSSNKSVLRLQELLNRSVDTLVERTNARFENDLISDDELLSLIERIQTRQLQIAELYRKIIQSPKGLFAEDNLSEEEKRVMKLFKSFKTVDEKKKFLELVQQALTPEVESFD